MSGPALRRHGIEAAAVLTALHGRCFADPWSGAAFADLLRLPGSFALVAEEAGAAVGFVLVRLAADEAEILTLGVDPAHRRRGIARRLVAGACELAAAGGASRMFLEVAIDNAGALALYAALDFAPAGRRPAYYASRGAPAIDARILVRRLAPP